MKCSRAALFSIVLGLPCASLALLSACSSSSTSGSTGSPDSSTQGSDGNAGATDGSHANDARVTDAPSDAGSTEDAISTPPSPPPDGGSFFTAQGTTYPLTSPSCALTGANYLASAKDMNGQELFFYFGVTPAAGMYPVVDTIPFNPDSTHAYAAIDIAMDAYDSENGFIYVNEEDGGPHQFYFGGVTFRQELGAQALVTASGAITCP